MSSALTEAEVKRVFNVWVRRMRLRHWTFHISFSEEPLTDGREAEILMAPDYDYGQVRFAPNWQYWEVKLLNEVILHELIHAHLHKLQVAALEGKQGFSPEAGRLYNKRLIHELERATDALTVSILKQLGNA